ncbi:MAG TPA: MFS transporter, partial [Rugosimonospora sp.]
MTAVAAVFFAATGVLFWPSAPASALPSLGGQCAVQKWQDPTQWDDCVGKLSDVTADEAQCVQAPTPEAPDSGMAGWFATRPTSAPSDADGMFTNYGYAGYDYSTYDTGCLNVVTHPDAEFENTVANGEFMFATGVIGASDALRDKAS